ARRRRAYRSVAAAMDELVNLREELDLANAAAPALQVEAGAERLALGVMIADAARNTADLADRAKIERAAPDERADRVEETSPQFRIARRRPAPDERSALPGQRQRFIIGDGGIDRQHDRRDLG